MRRPSPSRGELAVVDEVEHPVLDDLRVGGQAFEFAVGRMTALATLPTPDKRQQLGEAACRLGSHGAGSPRGGGNGFRVLVGGFERQIPVWRLGLDDGNYFGRIDTQARVADALHGFQELDGQTLGWPASAVVDVVESLVVWCQELTSRMTLSARSSQVFEWPTELPGTSRPWAESLPTSTTATSRLP